MRRALAFLAGSGLVGLGACYGPARISLGAAAPATTSRDGSPEGSAEGVVDASAPPAPDGSTDAPEASPDGPPGPLFYLSPTGDNGNPGTRERPWRRFDFALGLLSPGATLVLLDGTYDGGTSGYFNARCDVTGTNTSDGTAAAPITMRAEHPRAAWIRGDASGPPFYMDNCSYWTIEGLRVTSDDFMNAPDTPDAGSVIFLGPANDHVVLRRLLASHPNRYKHSHVVRIGDGSHDITVEECEVYDFHHNAFETTRTDTVIFRRNYVNARTSFAADLAGGYASIDSARGDYGFLLEETRFALVENNLVENTYAGVGIVGRDTGFPADQPPPASDPLDFNRVLGNVVYHASSFGIRLESRCAASQVPCTESVRIVQNTELTDDVVVGGAVGVSSAGAVQTRVSQLMVVGAGSGVVFAKEPQNQGITSSSRTVDSLVVDFQTTGFRADGQDDWSFDHCAGAPAAGTMAPLYEPDDAHVASRVAAAPDLGACLVYLPAGSRLRGAGSGTRDVGASVLDRYENGVLTTKPRWAPGTGAFPCGDVVAGVNDDASTSCIGVHTRLHVAAATCPLP
jgi:hypothetical protein